MADTIVSPFDSLCVSDCAALSAADRSVCPGCKRSSKNFCPKCNLPLDHIPPKVLLPIPLDMQTTSTHAKLVSQSQVEIYVDDLSTASDSAIIKSRYPDPSRVLLLFPSATAVPLSQIEISSFDCLVVIDGTWKQAKSMTKRLSNVGFRHVKIESHETLFWRYQQFDRTFLATIEAIYWFYREYFDAYIKAGPTSESDSSVPIEYSGEYDNLLFYFKNNWELIQHFYKTNPQKSFTPRHADGANYIQYRTDDGPVL
ncbi:hypothetical protein BSLG_003418 [Batrachochytrium salamandrivorans]|nr:hypothetical protein BSLG_003418 [Batrachochytrium salamandrivorans]